jgi:hypothetical protein
MVDSKHRSSSTPSAPAATLAIGTVGTVALLLTARRQRYTKADPYGLITLFLLMAPWQQSHPSPSLEDCAQRVVKGVDLRSIASRCTAIDRGYRGK